jgi:hypothetical protein
MPTIELAVMWVAVWALLRSGMDNVWYLRYRPPEAGKSLFALNLDLGQPARLKPAVNLDWQSQALR